MVVLELGNMEKNAIYLNIISIWWWYYGTNSCYFHKIFTEWNFWHNHQSCLCKCVKANNRAVQKITSLYCSAAFKTRNRQQLCHIMILLFKANIYSVVFCFPLFLVTFDIRVGIGAFSVLSRPNLLLAHLSCMQRSLHMFHKHSSSYKLFSLKNFNAPNPDILACES